MESNRLQKVNQLIQEDMAEIFRLDAAKIQKGMIISVTEVRTTPDLGIAKIYLSVFPTQYRQLVHDYIDQNHSYFRKQLGDKIGKQMRLVPELQFYSDTTLDQVDDIEKALRGEGDNPVL